MISGYFWHQKHPFFSDKEHEVPKFSHRGAEFTGAEGKRVTVWGGGGCMFFWATGGGSVTPGWGGNSQLHLGREDISDLVEKKPSIPSLKIPRLFGGLVATSC